MISIREYLKEIVGAEVLYLLHFDRPLDGGRNPRHYLGYSTVDALEQRLDQHLTMKKRGAKIVRAALLAGREVTLARVWEGDRYDESRLKKNGKNFSRICPICQEEVICEKLRDIADAIARDVEGDHPGWDTSYDIYVGDNYGVINMGEVGAWVYVWNPDKYNPRWELTGKEPHSVIERIKAA